MSGSDNLGTTSGYGGYGGDSSLDNCLELLVVVRLTSTKESILNNLKIDEIVAIIQHTENDIVSIVASTINDCQIIGSLSSSYNIDKILNCLEKGYILAGRIVEIDEGNCVIEVRCTGERQ